MELKSILVVEDSEADQYITKRVIQQLDPSIEIIEAFDGQEALEILESLQEFPSLILLDINMPRMNGFEFLEVYSSRYSSSVVVMLTSSDQESDKQKAFQFDAVIEYIVKPPTVKDLEGIVAKHFF